MGIRTTEEPEYRVIRKDGAFSLREYDELITVVTEIEGNYEEAGNKAFWRLFNYISGENKSVTEILMTAPVISREKEKKQGQKIPMTAPVLNERVDGNWEFAFVLPSTYTQDTAPMPTDPHVKLKMIPKKKVAVIRYSGSWDKERLKKTTDLLSDWINQNEWEVVSQPRMARYDPPWTLPFLKRNEVMIDVK